MHMYKMLMYVSAPCKLQQVRQNADGATVWQLCYESCLQKIHSKPTATDNMHEYNSAMKFTSVDMASKA
jgi:hypothetical protein